MTPGKFEWLLKKRKKIAYEKKQKADEKKRWLRKIKPKQQKVRDNKIETEHLKIQKLSYRKFLQSNYWRMIKKIILKRDKNSCIICGKTENLEIHHSTYKHHKNEHLHLEDLSTLCHSHHYEWHCTVNIRD